MSHPCGGEKRLDIVPLSYMIGIIRKDKKCGLKGKTPRWKTCGRGKRHRGKSRTRWRKRITRFLERYSDWRKRTGMFRRRTMNHGIRFTSTNRWEKRDRVIYAVRILKCGQGSTASVHGAVRGRETFMLTLVPLSYRNGLRLSTTRRKDFICLMLCDLENIQKLLI